MQRRLKSASRERAKSGPELWTAVAERSGDTAFEAPRTATSPHRAAPHHPTPRRSPPSLPGQVSQSKVQPPQTKRRRQSQTPSAGALQRLADHSLFYQKSRQPSRASSLSIAHPAHPDLSWPVTAHQAASAWTSFSPASAAARLRVKPLRRSLFRTYPKARYNSQSGP